MQLQWINISLCFGAVILTCRASGQSATCEMNDVKKDSKNCTREYVDTMITKDQPSNCSDAFKKMHSCVHDIVFAKCFASLVDRISHIKPYLEKILESYFRSLTSLDVMFCGQVVGEKVNVSTVPSAIKQFIPCKQEAYTEVPECALAFFTTFQANKTDPSLCRKYIQAKECEHDVRKKYCKQEMAPEVEPYDPFCTAPPNVHGAASQYTPMTSVAFFPVLFVFKLLLM